MESQGVQKNIRGRLCVNQETAPGVGVISENGSTNLITWLEEWDGKNVHITVELIPNKESD